MESFEQRGSCGLQRNDVAGKHEAIPATGAHEGRPHLISECLC